MFISSKYVSATVLKFFWEKIDFLIFNKFVSFYWFYLHCGIEIDFNSRNNNNNERTKKNGWNYFKRFSFIKLYLF